jgi:beta-glucosidase
VAHAAIPYEVNDCAAHRELAHTAARESLVLLKNANRTLPLSKTLGSLAVIGPNAHDPEVLLGNYFGTPSATVTPLDGIRAAVSAGTKVWYAPGCKLQGMKDGGLGAHGNLSEAVSVAMRAEAVVLVLGLSADIEGEQGDAGNSEASGDKLGLELTGLQQRLMEEVVALGKPTVLVVVAGSALDLRWAAADAHVDAIVQAWYPGEEAGRAIADVLFGDYNPAGRLPVTFPGSTHDLPDITDYRMRGRTYRYLEREPLFPFGYGLSYTQFTYGGLGVEARGSTSTEGAAAGVPATPGGRWPVLAEVHASVTNTGAHAGDEVVQLYVKHLDARGAVPHHSLRGFARVALAPGESRQVTFPMTARDLSLIDETGARVLEPGRLRLTVGGSQPDPRSFALTGQAPLVAELGLTGARRLLPY